MNGSAGGHHLAVIKRPKCGFNLVLDWDLIRKFERGVNGAILSIRWSSYRRNQAHTCFKWIQFILEICQLNERKMMSNAIKGTDKIGKSIFGLISKFWTLKRRRDSPKPFWFSGIWGMGPTVCMNYKELFLPSPWS